MSDPVRSAIDALLDAIEQDSAKRIDFTHAIPREAAARILEGLVWLYGARQGSAASIYGAEALKNALAAVYGPARPPGDDHNTSN